LLQTVKNVVGHRQDKPVAVVNQEFPKIDQDKMVSPHAQEIEYALILSRLIGAVKDDPAQIRATIYEFARARLKIDTSVADESERERLAAALETAIQGVETFTVRYEGRELLPPPAPAPQIAQRTPFAQGSPTTVATRRPVTPAADDILPPERTYPEVRIILESQPRAMVSMLVRFCAGMLLFVLLVALAYYKQSLPALWERLNLPLSASTGGAPAGPDTPRDSVAPADARQAAASNQPPFPLPSDYGVYVLSSGALSELTALPIQVPDKRIAVSTPLNEPSLTTLPDGKAKFVVFRRDLAGNAPERVEVRVVARVVRALTFDAKGKPSLLPVADTWSIRNVSYEFRVRPVAGNPEMLLVQPEKADFTLPAGRYVLVLKGQGYDFTVGGNIKDLAQCLERTEAANGAFYSECLKL
jgi:hypothetical protein